MKKYLEESAGTLSFDKLSTAEELQNAWNNLIESAPPLNIIYEDEHVLVVKKDAGIPVEAGRLRIMDLQGLIKNELYKRNRKGGEPYLGLIHRLDQPVEGVMVFAKTPFAANSP